jgi:hypothetical protein
MSGIVVDGHNEFFTDKTDWWGNYRDVYVADQMNSAVAFTSVTFQKTANNGLHAGNMSNITVDKSTFQQGYDVALFSDGTLSVTNSHFTNNRGAAVESRKGPTSYLAGNWFCKNQYDPPGPHGPGTAGGGMVFVLSGDPGVTPMMTVTMINSHFDGAYDSTYDQTIMAQEPYGNWCGPLVTYGGTNVSGGIELNCDSVAPAVNYSGSGNIIENTQLPGYAILGPTCNALLHNEKVSGNHESGIQVSDMLLDGYTHISMTGVMSINNPYDSNPSLAFTGYGVYCLTPITDSKKPVCINQASDVTTMNGSGPFGYGYAVGFMQFMQQPSCPAQVPSIP